jgi:glyoxylase-like metal-dependent hydrolase (beta-lactamase superfamily II)
VNGDGPGGPLPAGQLGVSSHTIDGSGTSRARCVLAPNPSPMTLDGTNTWVIAEPGADTAVVIDPGPADEDHLRRVAGFVSGGGRRVELILLTHGHRDHSGGARRFAEFTRAAVRALDPAHRLGEEGLNDGDVITAGGCELHVVASPGHSADSLSFLLSVDQALLTGDTVLGRGTAVIARDGNLGDYLRSLDSLRSLVDSAQVQVLMPGHGPLARDPAATLDYYIAHRADRLAEVEAALDAGDRTIDEIVGRVYAEIDPAVRRFAAWSVHAQLAYLAERGSLPPGVTF